MRWWTHRTRLRDQRCQGPWHVMVTPVTKERLVMAGDFNGKKCRRSWITKSHQNATRHKGHKGLQIKTSDAGPPGRRCVGCTRRRRLGAMDGECALLEENNFQEPLMMKWVYGVYGQYPATIQVMNYQDEHNLFRSRSQPSLDAWTSRWQGYSILPFLCRERRPRGRVESQPSIFC